MWRAMVLWALALVCTWGAGDAAAFQDDFASYPDLATGEPVWASDSVMWEMRDGAFECVSPGRSFAIYSAAPFAIEQDIEVTLAIAGTTTDQWKIAGLVVFEDDGNFWHLALVESPDADGARHFVELVESYDGRWLSEAAAETKLTAIERTGWDFPWEYGQPYRLRLRLTGDRIEGTVTDANGRTVSRIAYRLDNPRSVGAGYAGLDSGGFDSRFDDFRLEVSKTREPPAQDKAVPPVEVRAWSGLHGEATGFFRIAERDGRWWLSDPEGRAFYILGTDHANYNVHWCEALGYAPYHRNMVEQYGSEEAWADSTLARLKSWGFNTVAANHSTSLRHRGLAHIDLLGFGTSFAAHDDICPQVHWTGFPNVFSPKWKEHCRKQARQRCAAAKDDPWLIGYFLDNELEWYGKSYRPWGLADEAFKKPADHTAKIALVDFLRDRYDGDVGAFNHAWGVHVRGFESLLGRRRPIGEDGEAARADKMAFVRLIAERYFSACAEAIREFDPNHLVLGCRFAGQAPDIWDVAGRHCDIVSVNCYRQADLNRGVIIGFEEDLRRWHRAAQRPLMITEWSFPALDSGLPCEHGAGQRFDTQQQRAAAWGIFQELLFRTPYLVGSDYFMWVDEPALGISSTFPEDTNYGLVNERDEPYAELTQTARRVNRLVYSLHAGRVADLRPMFSGTPPRLRVRNNGPADAEATVRIWVDGTQRDIEVAVPAESEVDVALDLPASPGAHLVQCVVDPDAALAEGDRTDNEAHAAWYVAGLPWAEGIAGDRVPIVVANPTDVDLSTALVQASGRGLSGLRRAWTPEAGWLPCWPDSETGGVLLTLPELPAHAAAAIFLHSTSNDGDPTSTGTGQDGFVTISPGGEGEAAAAALFVDDERVGRLVPLIWQRTPEDRWVQPQLATCEVREFGPVVHIRATVAHRGRNADGVIGRHDQPGERLDAPRAFACGYSLLWVRGRPWFTARLEWVRSDDEQPWECPAYFHYLLPDFEAEVAGPDVPGYYRPFAAWRDGKSGTAIGAMGVVPGEFNVYFWKDERGGLHPDARRDVAWRFTKNNLFDEAQPRIVIFAAKGEEAREASSAIWRQARAERMLETIVAPVERHAPPRAVTEGGNR